MDGLRPRTLEGLSIVRWSAMRFNTGVRMTKWSSTGGPPGHTFRGIHRVLGVARKSRPRW
jgi:hypothetical protein